VPVKKVAPLNRADQCFNLGNGWHAQTLWDGRGFLAVLCVTTPFADSGRATHIGKLIGPAPPNYGSSITSRFTGGEPGAYIDGVKLKRRWRNEPKLLLYRSLSTDGIGRENANIHRLTRIAPWQVRPMQKHFALDSPAAMRRAVRQ